MQKPLPWTTKADVKAAIREQGDIAVAAKTIST
jgi:hypothetical protein